MRLPGCIDVDPISNRQGIAVVALVAQAEEALAPCGFRVDPGASGIVAVTMRGNDGGEGFSATVAVRARHQSVVNGSVLSVYIYDDEATVASRGISRVGLYEGSCQSLMGRVEQLQAGPPEEEYFPLHPTQGLTL